MWGGEKEKRREYKRERLRREKYSETTFVSTVCLLRLCVVQSRGPAPQGERLHSEGSKVYYSAFTYKGHTYKIKDGVYLPSDTYKFPVEQEKQDKPVSQKKGHIVSDRKDEDKFPELYRKSEYVKGSNLDVPKPFQIGETVRSCDFVN